MSAREQRQLRATLTEDPSSSYAYHDEERVEHTRPPGASRPANDTASMPSGAPKQRFAKSTMVGGHHAPGPSLSPGDAGSLPAPGARGAGARRPGLSEPPEIGSWPPLPNVPDDLEAAPAAGGGTTSEAPDDLAPTAPPKRGVTSLGPGSGSIWGAIPSVVGQAVDHAGKYSEPPPDDEDANDAQAAEAIVIPALEAAPTAPAPAAPVPREAGYRDPELARLEPLVERGAWEALAKELSPDPARSAAYRLMHVLAQRETQPSDDKGSGHLTQDAIVALAELLGVPNDSPTALMLAKRLLRRNPVWVQKQPDTGLSVGIVVMGLIVGTGLGWLLTRFVL